MGIVVNQFWLDHLWDPVSSETATDAHPLDDLNVTDAHEVRRLVREYLAPGFTRLTSTQQQALKESFRYGLNALSDHQLERTLARCLPPFRVPQHVRLQVPQTSAGSTKSSGRSCSGRMTGVFRIWGSML